MRKYAMPALLAVLLVTGSSAGTLDRMIREELGNSVTGSDRYPPEIGYGAQYEQGRKSLPLALFLSASLPGAGEYYMGSELRSKVFVGVEAAAWASFLAFTYHGRRTRDDYRLFASAMAGADRSIESEEYWNAIEWNSTNEAYNERVREEARGLFPGDYEKQQQYIRENSYGGDLAWSWADATALENYRRLRRGSRDAFQFAVYSTGAALLNRLVSLMDVIIIDRSGRKKPPFGQTVGLVIEPGEETASIRVGLVFKER